MAEIRIEELFPAQTQSIDASGNIKSATVNYVVFGVEGTPSENITPEENALRAVLEYLQINNLKTIGSASLDSVDIEERCNEDTFKVSAKYTVPRGSSGSSGDSNEEATMSFDCGSGSARITQSFNQTIYRGGDPHGLIGWNGKTGNDLQVAGVDVVTAQLRETYTMTMKVSDMTSTKKREVANLVGKVNLNPFKGWEPGEVLFLGMSYSAPLDGNEDISVVFNFSIQPNETAVIDDVAVAKRGFDYPWTIAETVWDETTQSPVVNVSGIYVDQVYQYADFSKLGIGG